ncbi:phage tail tube protein [Amycolatopsis kentuckyensis]|uniref:phage tail tube protein n=1 Tax=Amycolatopsis kentuckyensis TaxID=218823 RepID=UPI003569CF9B
MADMLSDGNNRVSFVPAIANPAAPTVAELNAGTSLEGLIMGDGLDINTDEDTVTADKLSETTHSESPGRSKTTIQLTCVRKDVPAQDVAWTTLLRGLTGYLVVRRGVAYTTAWTIGQKPEVYPVKFGQRRMLKPEANGVEKFMSQGYNTAAPVLDAVVA